MQLKLDVGEKILESKLVKKILISLSFLLVPKETTIEENKDKDIDSIRVNELMESLQTYKIPLPSSMRPKDESLKAHMKESNESKEYNDQCLTYVELSFFFKNFKNAMEPHKRSFTKLDSRKRKGFELNKRKKEKSSSKKKKIECFNCGGMGHMVVDCPCLKNIRYEGYVGDLE